MSIKKKHWKKVGGICDVLTDEVEFKWEIRQFRKVKIHMESDLAWHESSAIRSYNFCTKLSFDMHSKYWYLKLLYSKDGTYKIEFRRTNYHSDDKTASTTVSVELFILNNEQKKEKLNDVAKVHFRDRKDFYSYPFSNSNILKDEKFVFNDTLTIICNLVEYGEPTTHPYVPVKDFPENLLKNIKNLLTSAQHSDVTLIVDETEFKVHKIILAAVSPVFAVMFNHKDLEEFKTNQVVIKDTNPKIMKIFLKYIYSGEIEELDEEKFDLWILADKYQIETLKNYCEQLISCCVNEQCVLEVLKFADLHNIKDLLDYTLNYFVTRCKNTIKDGEWKSMAKINPRLFNSILDTLFYNR